MCLDGCVFESVRLNLCIQMYMCIHKCKCICYCVCVCTCVCEMASGLSLVVLPREFPKRQRSSAKRKTCITSLFHLCFACHRHIQVSPPTHILTLLKLYVHLLIYLQSLVKVLNLQGKLICFCCTLNLPSKYR